MGCAQPFPEPGAAQGDSIELLGIEPLLVGVTWAAAKPAAVLFGKLYHAPVRSQVLGISQ